MEPDAVSTDEGKSEMILPLSPFPEVLKFIGMEITINNQKKALALTGATVQQLLDLEIPGKQKGIAVAINNHVVPKAEWPVKTLEANDSVLIIRATQGG